MPIIPTRSGLRKADYRSIYGRGSPMSTSRWPLCRRGPSLLRNFPEVEVVARGRRRERTCHPGRGRRSLVPRTSCYSEPAIFSIFGFKFLEGTAGRRPGGAEFRVSLSRSAEKKIFWRPACTRKDTGRCNRKPYRITGVFGGPTGQYRSPDRRHLCPKSFRNDGWLTDDLRLQRYILIPGEARPCHNSINGCPG